MKRLRIYFNSLTVWSVVLCLSVVINGALTVKQYEVPAIAKICGPNHPIPDEDLLKYMIQVEYEGCQETVVVRTEPGFSLVYGVKHLIGE